MGPIYGDPTLVRINNSVRIHFWYVHTAFDVLGVDFVDKTSTYPWVLPWHSNFSSDVYGTMRSSSSLAVISITIIYIFSPKFNESSPRASKTFSPVMKLVILRPT